MGHLIGAAISMLLAAGAAEAGEKVKLLILNGQNNHDWEATSRSLKATLLKTGRFDVEVSTSPPAKSPGDAWAAWRPDFPKYGVVLLDYNGEAWPEPVRESFLNYVGRGGGLVSVHAGNNGFSDWPEFNLMIGLGWRKADYGARIAIDDATGKKIRTEKGEGFGAGHGPQHSFLVKVRAPDHPIMKGIPASWMHSKDELYHGQRGPGENMTVLESAFSDKEKGGTGEHEPISWIIPFGKGQVVTNVLGHHWKGQEDFEALHCVGFQTVIARSCEWAATGKVTIPVPADFPGTEKPVLSSPE